MRESVAPLPRPGLQAQPHALKEIAAQLDAVLISASGEEEIDCLVSLSDMSGGRGGIAPFFEEPYLDAARASRAAFLLCSQRCSARLNAARPRLEVKDGRSAWAQLLTLIYPAFHAVGEVSARAEVHPSAHLAEGVKVEPFAVIAAGAKVDAHVWVRAGAYVGERVVIGAASQVGPGAVIEADVQLGKRVWIGAHAVIGSLGFGIAPGLGRLPHPGRVIIGDGASIGAGSCVDRGPLGDTIIAPNVHLDNLVQIGHGARVHAGAVIAAQSGLAGGAEVGAGARLGGQVGVNNRAIVGAGSELAAKSGVTRSLAPGGRYSGYPAEAHLPRLRREAQLRRVAARASSTPPEPRSTPAFNRIEQRSGSPAVHPSATIDPSAFIDPRAIVGARAIVGPRCTLEPYAIVGADTVLGAECELSPFSVVGATPQLHGENSPSSESHGPRLICGEKNIFREGCTISLGSSVGGGLTRIGKGNLFMHHSHVGHDARLGDRCTLANGVSLAGHVELGDQVTVGGHAGVHQFVRIGRLAFIAAGAMVSNDIPPYCLAAGDRARLRGLNRVGLQRAGLSAPLRATLKRAFIALRRGELELTEAAIDQAEPELRALLSFLKTSTRGIAPHQLK